MTGGAFLYVVAEKGVRAVERQPCKSQGKYRRLVTSEAVTEGHPVKLCDKIADAILDSIIKEDPGARVACEVAATTGLVLVMGEITTPCWHTMAKVADIVRETVMDIGYTRAKYGFDAETCGVITSINGQSSDIAQGVNNTLEPRQLEAAGETKASG